LLNLPILSKSLLFGHGCRTVLGIGLISTPHTQTHTHTHTMRMPRSNRFVALVSSCLCILIAGSLFAFGSYSSNLKKRFGLSQQQLNIIIDTAWASLYFGYPIGAFNDKFGPRLCLLLSGFMCTLGNLVTYVGVRSSSLLTSASAATGVLSACYMLVGQGGEGAFVAVFAPNLSAFPASHGSVTGSLVSNFALAGLIFGLLAPFVITHQSLDAYFLLCAILTAVIFLQTAVLINPVKSTDKDDADAPLLQDTEAGASILVGDQAMAETKKRSVLTDSRFWYCFLILGLVDGGCIMFNSNLGQIATASGHAHLRHLCVYLFSVCDVVARLIVGWASDRFSKQVSRPTLVCFVSCLMMLSFCGMAWSGEKFLLPAAALAGFSDGALFSILPAIVAAEFDPADFGKIWGLMMSSGAIGVFGFGQLAGAVYDANADNHKCLGEHCFQTSFLACIASCIVGILSAVALRHVSKRRSRFHDIKPVN